MANIKTYKQPMFYKLLQVLKIVKIFHRAVLHAWYLIRKFQFYNCHN